MSGDDWVQYRLALTDTSNQPLPTDASGNPQVEVGQTFRLQGYTQDLRVLDDPAKGGVFAAYMDVFYANAGLITVVPSDGTFHSAFKHVSPFINGVKAVDKVELEAGQEGLGGRSFGSVGGFTGQSGADDPTVESRFFYVNLKAVSAGQVSFSGNPSNYEEALPGENNPYQGTETLVYPSDPALPEFIVEPQYQGFVQGLGNPLVLQIVPIDVAWDYVQVGDVNSDGRDDVVGRTSIGGWRVALSTGTEFVNSYWGSGSSGVSWLDVHLVDVDGDHLPDIAGRDTNGSWWVARNTGSAFDAAQLWASGWDADPNHWLNIWLTDVTGDAKADVVAQYADGSWWVGKSSGASFQAELWGTGWDANPTHWLDMQATDVTGDGKADIVGRYSDGSWWVGKSNGANFQPQLWGTGWDPDRTQWLDMQFADVNGDGNTDVTGRYIDGSWWVGVSTGASFQPQLWATQWDPNPNHWIDVWGTDVTGDGKAEIVGRYIDGSWWVGESTGVNFQPRLFATGWDPDPSHWFSFQVADVTGDGKVDILGQYLDGSWWVGESTGSSFQPRLWMPRP